MDANTSTNPSTNGPKQTDRLATLKAGVFFGCITFMSLLSGFGMTLGMTKKQDPNSFAKGLAGAGAEIPESGISLASRALARGSLYAVGGFSLVCFTVWKLVGAKDMVEFRQKVGHALPKVPKKDNQGRSEFATLRDLVNYIIDEDEKAKKRKQAKSSEIDQPSS